MPYYKNDESHKAFNNATNIEIEIGEDIVVAGGSGDKHYTFIQNEPSAIWLINHGLNKCPSVSVVDSAGTKCHGEVKYIDANNVELHFGAEFSGKAYLN